MDELGVDRERVIKVFNKSDLVPAEEPRDSGALWVSAETGEGIPELKAELARRLGFGASGPGSAGRGRPGPGLTPPPPLSTIRAPVGP